MSYSSFVRKSMIAATSCLATANTQGSGVQELDLSDLSHGHVVSGQTINGVTIGVDNFRTNNSTQDFAVIFDSRTTPTRDSDLEDPFTVGNLTDPEQVVVGNLIIIQEAGVPTNTPDDEGRRPAGELFFDFATPITSFGFDLIDVEETGEFDTGTGFVATFDSGDESFTVAFREFIDPSSFFFDSTVIFGDNSANRITPITGAHFGATSFDAVTVNFGGSAGIANINFSVVPVPGASAASLAGMSGLALMAWRKRRQRTHG